MADSKQNPETLAASGFRENDQASKRVDREYTENAPIPQRLIAAVAKSGREEYRITLKTYNGDVKAEIRVFERKLDGAWTHTPRHIVIGRGSISEIINALVEAEARL
jgi:hypothetical protein